jgi:hypothetical protein
MTGRLIAAVGLAVSFLFNAPAFAAPSPKLDTCNFGADDQKLTGAARKSFMAKCMSNKDAPRGKPMKPAPKAQ